MFVEESISTGNGIEPETAAQPWVGRVPPAFIVIIAGMVAALGQEGQLGVVIGRL